MCNATNSLSHPDLKADASSQMKQKKKKVTFHFEQEKSALVEKV